MKKLLLGLILFSIFSESFAQKPDKLVTLVVIGQGKSLEEANQNGLRSAIEQAFGTFISTKTSILNDQIINEEIISISNGTIQQYEIISVAIMPNGNYNSTIKATISISNLVKFVEQKGENLNFNGALLALNINQQIINEKNEISAINNLYTTCQQILKTSTDYYIKSSQPKQYNNNNYWSVPIFVEIRFNKNIENFDQIFINTLSGISMSNEEVELYKQLQKKTFPLIVEAPKNFNKSFNRIYHFRTQSSIEAVINLINYSKNILLNFEVNNGFEKINYKSLMNDLIHEYNNRGRKILNQNSIKSTINFCLTSCKLNPIYIDNSNYWNYNIRNFPSIDHKGFVWMSTHVPVERFKDRDSDLFYFFRYSSEEKSYNFTRNENKFSMDIFFNTVRIKTNLILSKETNFFAAISLYNFLPNQHYIAKLKFENILMLENLNLVNNYSIGLNETN